MNIQRLKTLVANLPAEVTGEQLGMIELEVEDLLAQQRQADEAKLAEVLAEADALRQKLGVSEAPRAATPPPRPTRAQPDRDLTDEDMGLADENEGMSAADFRRELIELRNYNVDKRRRLS